MQGAVPGQMRDDAGRGGEGGERGLNARSCFPGETATMEGGKEQIRPRKEASLV